VKHVDYAHKCLVQHKMEHSQIEGEGARFKFFQKGSYSFHSQPPSLDVRCLATDDLNTNSIRLIFDVFLHYRQNYFSFLISQFSPADLEPVSCLSAQIGYKRIRKRSLQG
jgi:hypothetical protein